MVPHLTGHFFLENWVVQPPSVSTLQMTIYMQAELSETDSGLPLQWVERVRYWIVGARNLFSLLQTSYPFPSIFGPSCATDPSKFSSPQKNTKKHWTLRGLIGRQQHLVGDLLKMRFLGCSKGSWRCLGFETFSLSLPTHTFNSANPFFEIWT